MKVCILGNTTLPGYKHGPYSWFVLTHLDGLKHNDIETHTFNYKQHTIKEIKEYLLRLKADYVLTHLTFHNFKPTESVLQMFREVNKKVGTKFIHTCNDARNVDRYRKDISGAIYMAFVGSYGMVKSGKKDWNIPVFYYPYASLTYDEMASPVEELKFMDAVFTGSPTAHPDRSRFIHLLNKVGLPIKIFQTQSGNDMRHRTPELSVSAASILGLCTGYDISGYIDVRPFQYMGTGACFIGRKYKEMEKLIPDKLYMPFYGYTQNDALEVLEYHRSALIDDTTKMRYNAFKHIQKYHSSKTRVKQMFDVLEEKEDKIL